MGQARSVERPGRPAGLALGLGAGCGQRAQAIEGRAGAPPPRPKQSRKTARDRRERRTVRGRPDLIKGSPDLAIPGGGDPGVGGQDLAGGELLRREGGGLQGTPAVVHPAREIGSERGARGGRSGAGEREGQGRGSDPALLLVLEARGISSRRRKKQGAAVVLSDEARRQRREVERAQVRGKEGISGRSWSSAACRSRPKQRPGSGVEVLGTLLVQIERARLGEEQCMGRRRGSMLGEEQGRARSYCWSWSSAGMRPRA